MITVAMIPDGGRRGIDGGRIGDFPVDGQLSDIPDGGEWIIDGGRRIPVDGQ